ncbi:MAG: N(4)-(beta-N-acetylglucosaminyl)-L-asparaginase [Gemmatimonadetes bacterium]|uniref:N(4)-(Beta-N-acetylglucosaminyl)-L-asparaginase n=1 Tax=Candidatus Kutchimonas denitrificans TaxID=3056748 RepID=A0AAE4ZAR3_9BACT|nr:N(4)-(beta-N-acetylglucosaminyl)-L-asparaginase [Gemmatimonadota bacterium]NIR74666.1 N(4)-(beta-N-acetylglucosaminyl)-L-asparaginase [Candidatus Kutchimonas denitrificans]NIS01416.1 N(4)-(beta-N-acetylglucosaminyl)-L-asparaginase [Gemmatimonadota bacterium]NIT67157.1 N(4)-(beta-N-acetylglucosaminyl)-L-asparaginase [Gemmatimonadota bacterium]NIU52331.1 asparaginase [Gemmatimonadota bacterium]
MPKNITRRLFLRDSAVAGAGALLSQRLGELVDRDGSRRTPGEATTPIIVSSHRNETGHRALEAGWEILQAGGSALDAVERATNIIEEDPEDTSVGYGGLPNERGVVQLDASIMDGRTYNAGAVASLENIKHPSSVARLVMERTDHVMLVGPGALEFAKSWGFPEEELLTDQARQYWLRWRERHSDRDDWGPPDHLRERGGADAALPADWLETYGTVNVLAVDGNGDIAGITSTSGLSYKIPGRIGDSPIIGAGLYVDNEVGAAGATGRGEDVIKACSTYHVVMRMRQGRSPQEACEDALRDIAERYRAAGIDFMPGEKFVAINKAGELGCARTGEDDPAQMTVATADGLEIYTGTGLF